MWSARGSMSSTPNSLHRNRDGFRSDRATDAAGRAGRAHAAPTWNLKTNAWRHGGCSATSAGISIPPPSQRLVNAQHVNRRALGYWDRSDCELASRPLQADGVAGAAVLAGREPNALSFVKDFSRSRAINRFSVHLQPVADVFQLLYRLRRPGPVRHRAKADLEVASFGARRNEALQNPFGGSVFVTRNIRERCPAGINHFPQGGRPSAWNLSFRRMVVAVGPDPPVAHDHVRLELADHLGDIRDVPGRCLRPADVEVQRIDWPVGRHQLTNLLPLVIDEGLPPHGITLRREFWIVLVMKRIPGKSRIVPVDVGIIEPDSDAFLPRGTGQGADDVLLVRTVHDAVVVGHGLGVLAAHVESLGGQGGRLLRNRGRPHREAVVVLGGKGEEPDPAPAEKVHPGISIEAGRVEELVEDVVDVPELGAGARQAPRLVTADHAVQTPVNANPELEVLECLDGRLRRMLIVGINGFRPTALHRAPVKRGVQRFMPAAGARIESLGRKVRRARRCPRRSGNTAKSTHHGDRILEKTPSSHSYLPPAGSAARQTVWLDSSKRTLLYHSSRTRQA